MRWQFWIDVGGTFTDCVGRAPDGRIVTCKVLSSGVTKGQIRERTGPRTFIDPTRSTDPTGFWTGYELRLLDVDGRVAQTTRVSGFDTGRSSLMSRDDMKMEVGPGTTYELLSGEEAPVAAVRYLLGLPLELPIPPVDVRLGTTRGTNALLERKGARTAFITTRGFADVLLIANQDRPRLFDLAITKPEPLFTQVVEIDERLDAQGNVLRAPDEGHVRVQLRELRGTDVESIGICLLHAFANPAHEELVARIARDEGFREVSVSSRLSPLIKIVSRGDTTVADAYLNPVLRQYVERLRASLQGHTQDFGFSIFDFGLRSPEHKSKIQNPKSKIARSTLKLMTSAGGLVDADRFVGKDSILSGPAGGVIGFSRVAQQAGFPKSIGFDMGGTSTDVSRFDGRYELEFETKKAGVRVVAPMLAIETVAAGGGSICDFDGVKLVVGPESAGADPGPACYGRGGPLTVTDVNLALGRILPARFPFPLDERAVQRRLEELCRRVAASPLGREYTPVELAQGFVDIANANMVRAIRRISVARGYDPADYVLVTFGGAGAQHACAMARLLGTKKILLHPLAGILSAYGMGLADVRRFAEQAVLRPYSPETLAEIEPLTREMEDRLREDVLAEGISPEHVQPALRSLDIRYRGVESTINVPRPDDGDYAARYEALHEQLFGYRHGGRGLEVTAVRVEVVGTLETPLEPATPPQPRRPQPAETTRAWFAGRQLEAGVFHRRDLRSGDEIDGPAILCEPTSTVVVDPGFVARILERDEVLISDRPHTEKGRMEDRGSRMEENTQPSSILYPPSSTPHSSLTLHPSSLIPHPSSAPDPVQLEIFNNLFASIAEQMGVTLQKTSISTNVKERLDFSCAIFDPQGGLVCNAPHIPVHLGAMSETVKAILADNPDMRPGDVFVTNDPYRGGSHLPDVTVVTPVFADFGISILDFGFEDASTSTIQNPESKIQNAKSKIPQPLFLTASRAHHAEIGGIVPGSMPPFSKRLSEEGVLIRNFKLVNGGASREAALKELLLDGVYPTRNVHDNLADVSAQVAANNTGVKLLCELVERYSLPVVEAYMGHIQEAAAAKMRMALAKLPDGVCALTDHLDDGSPIAVSITIAGDRATVDFTGTGPVLASNLNANRAIVTAAVLYVFRCLINDDIPLNSGVLAPVEIVLPECLLNPPGDDDPEKCAAIVGGNVETSQRVVDVLLGALQVAAASQGTMNNLTFGDATFGYYETICGGSGATPGAAGSDAVHTHMTNTRLTDVEVIERRYPVRVLEFSIHRGSGGAGTQRGGDGIVRRLEFLRALKVSMLSQRRGRFAPFGLHGGSPGQLGRNTLRRAGCNVDEDLGGCFQIDVQSGDVLTIQTPGGGGWGTAAASVD
jgi:5-oxoprolinase (ATP-hydrolysing)